MRTSYFVLLFLVGLLSSLCLVSCEQKNSTFQIDEKIQGVEIRENNQKVLFYQLKKKSKNGLYERNNYIHPLYSLEGDTLTEDFPEDHLYHRGIFWAWHQIYYKDSMIADGWTLENFNSKSQIKNIKKDSEKVVISLYTTWSSPLFKENQDYLSEEVQLKIFAKKDKLRVIDIQLKLMALADDIRIGGADNEKGYGGLCLRLKTPKDLVFTAEGGLIKPKNLQVDAGPWIDFLADFGGNGKKSGITLINHDSNYESPQSWILRQKASMQNIVFPGQEAIKIPKIESIVLNYRLLVHDDVSKERLQSESEKYQEIKLN